MAELQSVKETKEALIGLIKVGQFVIERTKDGVGLDDAMALGQKLLDPAFRQLVMDAAQGADQIPAELKDISLAEAVELIQAVAEAVKAA